MPTLHSASTQVPEQMEFGPGPCKCRPCGRYSLVDAVELVSRAISTCRNRGITQLLFDATGFVDLPIPSLVDRFLMVEDWAQEAKGVVVVALVTGPEYIHPKKFGMKLALQLGMVCDVFTTEAAALEWLLENEADNFTRPAEPG